MDETSSSAYVDVSGALPIPQYRTLWSPRSGYFRAVHEDGSVIDAATYREAVILCFIERTRRQGIRLRGGYYLLDVRGGGWLSGPGHSPGGRADG